MQKPEASLRALLLFEKIYPLIPKKVKKIILELSGKLKDFASIPKEEKDDLSRDESFSALVNLGFSKERIRKALSQIPKEIKTPEEKIKEALKILGR